MFPAAERLASTGAMRSTKAFGTDTFVHVLPLELDLLADPAIVTVGIFGAFILERDASFILFGKVSSFVANAAHSVVVIVEAS